IGHTILFLGGERAGGLKEMVDELRFGALVDPFERSGEPNQFGGRILLVTQLRQLWRQNRLLPLAVKPTGDSSPKYIKLKLDTFAGICGSFLMNPPKIIDSGIVPLRAESGSQKKTGENQPGFLMFDGFFAK